MPQAQNKINSGTAGSTNIYFQLWSYLCKMISQTNIFARIQEYIHDLSSAKPLFNCFHKLTFHENAGSGLYTTKWQIKQTA